MQCRGAGLQILPSCSSGMQESTGLAGCSNEHQARRLLNVFTDGAVTTDSGKLFQFVVTRWEK